MRVVCPGCRTPLNVRDEHAGMKVQCGTCGEEFYCNYPDSESDPIDDVLRQLAEHEAVTDSQDPVAGDADALSTLALHPIMVTTPYVHIPGLKIARTLPIIGATHVEGIHLFKDLASEFRDIFGGRSRAMESSYHGLYAGVLEDLQKQAIARRAHAIIGVVLDFGEMPGKMLYLAAHGTPVVMVRS